MNITKEIIGWICSIIIVVCNSPVLFAAEKPFTVINEEKKIFSYRTVYPFWEQRYSPRVNFQILEGKYVEAQYSNPYPEELATFILLAMKRGDYEHWLNFWSLQTQQVLKAADSTLVKIENRKDKWKNMFKSDNDVFLTTLIHVGEAQYTYIMAVFEIVKKSYPDKTVEILYIPMMVAEDGKWYAARELFSHPVLNRYIENARIYFKEGKPSSKP